MNHVKKSQTTSQSHLKNWMLDALMKDQIIYQLLGNQHLILFCVSSQYPSICIAAVG